MVTERLRSLLTRKRRPLNVVLSEESFRCLSERKQPWAETLDFPNHITPTSLHGVCMIHRKRFCDDRGSFQEIWRISDVEEIVGQKLIFKQSSHATRIPQETPILAGLHGEPQFKIVYPLSGRMLAVLVDLREDSSTFLQYEMITFGMSDTRSQRVAVLLPPGVANSIFAYKEPQDPGDGRLEYVYTVSEEYDPKTAGMGVRFDDLKLGIPWPCPDPIISDRDRNLPTLDEFLERYLDIYKSFYRR